MEVETPCKHNRIESQCYTCHVDNINSQEKTQLDTLYEIICELKIRISKLKEYKRLQEDLNKHINNDIQNLNGHRKNQFDENRDVSKYLAELYENINRLETTQTSQNRNFNNRISSLEKTTELTNEFDFVEESDSIVKMNVNIPKVLHKKMKQKAIDDDRTVTDIVIEVLWKIVE